MRRNRRKPIIIIQARACTFCGQPITDDDVTNEDGHNIMHVSCSYFR